MKKDIMCNNHILPMLVGGELPEWEQMGLQPPAPIYKGIPYCDFPILNRLPSSANACTLSLFSNF